MTKKKLVPWTQERVHAMGEVLPGRFQAIVDAGLGLRQGEILAFSLTGSTTA
ncbi:hypothetical protein [Nonomuraea jabiensis]|uniref:Uncharacterized protein n=1 Tax=Nonomuraea jabiensis TaxID=882448 RepID=A0A7W9GET3_9ACTN|nr:hypothetical protein [Nonomuraea jabiensis]MBB5782363.1 hypothetical protein [Nonomuraea jabiensis]